eukprot:scaffold201561_cov18-Prasinocladus_malaysianus.AAC.2
MEMMYGRASWPASNHLRLRNPDDDDADPGEQPREGSSVLDLDSGAYRYAPRIGTSIYEEATGNHNAHLATCLGLIFRKMKRIIPGLSGRPVETWPSRPIGRDALVTASDYCIFGVRVSMFFHVSAQ